MQGEVKRFTEYDKLSFSHYDESHLLILKTKDKNYLPVDARQLRTIVREELANFLKKEESQESSSISKSSPQLLVFEKDDETSLLMERFTQLVENWKQDTEFASTVLEMATHPAYQQIIGMGSSAIPFILERLEKKAEHWFWALTAISGDDPISEESRGRVDEMREAWLEWGRKEGYETQGRGRDKRAS